MANIKLEIHIKLVAILSIVMIAGCGDKGHHLVFRLQDHFRGPIVVRELKSNPQNQFGARGIEEISVDRNGSATISDASIIYHWNDYEFRLPSGQMLDLADHMNSTNPNETLVFEIPISRVPSAIDSQPSGTVVMCWFVGTKDEFEAYWKQSPD